MSRTIKIALFLTIAALAYPTYWVVRLEYRAWKTEIAPALS